MRPIAHLDGEFVLATGYLSNWKEDADDMAILTQFVQIFDYEKGKPLAPQLDHAWVWVTKKSWCVREQFDSILKERFVLHEPANFTAKVKGYTRSDGSKDYGLRLTNFYPTTVQQQAALRKALQSLEKTNNASLELLAGQRLALERIKLKIEDWRDYSDRSLRDARVQVLKIIARQESLLVPLYGREAVEKFVETRLSTDAKRQVVECLNV
jgi:adenylate kinase family enzyme